MQMFHVQMSMLKVTFFLTISCIMIVLQTDVRKLHKLHSLFEFSCSSSSPDYFDWSFWSMITIPHMVRDKMTYTKSFIWKAHLPSKRLISCILVIVIERTFFSGSIQSNFQLPMYFILDSTTKLFLFSFPGYHG